MGQLDQVSQQNASASEELSAIAEELNGQADMLMNAISKFKINQSVLDASAAKARSTEMPSVSFSGRSSDDEDDQEDGFQKF